MIIMLGIFIGPLLSEFFGYIWHRWACHLGAFRFLPKDVLRRRHYDHHEKKYTIDKLRTKEYIESCEIAFHPLGFLILLIMLTLVLMGLLNWVSFISIISGSVLYGFFVQGPLHTSYHIKYNILRKKLILRFKLIRKIYLWLRKCHDIHHKLNANYFILIPIDALFGTLVLNSSKKKKEDIFPGFDARLSSSCGKPLLH
ncbi:sterol desaturase family protein [Candidatus Woesearchaeota archaeon]|nr:sterol desaturase family protein [Candidatus Woesearchaeota archaeon]